MYTRMLEFQLLSTTCLFLVLVTLYIAFRKYIRIWKLMNSIPGPKGIFFFGNALQFWVKREERVENATRIFSEFYDIGYARVWLGPVPYVMIFRAEAAESLLSTTRHTYKAGSYNFLKPWLALGLLTSSGDKWFARRRMLTPAFHFRILEDFIPVFNEKSEFLVRKMKSQLENSNSVDLFRCITLCTLDIICASAMGCDLEAQLKEDSDYVTAVYRASEVIFERMCRPWLFPDFIFNFTRFGREQKESIKVLHDFTRKVIKERRREFSSTGNGKIANEDDSVFKKKRLAFLDMLIEYSNDGLNLSDDDIQEEVDTFMFEGHDTTSAGIYWSLYFLGLYPEVQKQVHEEVDAVLGKFPHYLTSDDIKKLKYLECVCKEALRMCPSVPMIGRTLTEDIKLDKYVVPAGVECIIGVYEIQNDPRYFPEPEVFKPERFLPENTKGRHPYAYVPFSAGPRNCIGQKFALMEEKVVLAQILRNFSVKTLHDATETRATPDLILRPLPGTNVCISIRDS